MDKKYEKNIELSKALFLEGFNCCQSVFAAFSDIYGIDRQTALRISASFGAGIGRMRETCGAACGMFMLNGLETGCINPEDREGKGANYAVVQQLAEEFRKRIGALRCADILKIRSQQKESPLPSVRDEEYYRSRPCLRNVETAAEIWAEYLSGISK